MTGEEGRGTSDNISQGALPVCQRSLLAEKQVCRSILAVCYCVGVGACQEGGRGIGATCACCIGTFCRTIM